MKVQKKGLQRIYQISNAAVVKFVSSLQGLAYELLPEAARAENLLVPSELRSSDTLHEVMQKAHRGQAVLLDARLPAERNDTDPDRVIPGLILPSSEGLEGQLKDKRLSLAKNRNYPVFVYCRGRYCVTAAEVTSQLRKIGFDAWCLPETEAEILECASRVRD